MRYSSFVIHLIHIMEVIMIDVYGKTLSPEDKKLIEKKGFKLKKTRKIDSSFYRGDIFEYSLPKGLEIHETTTPHTYFICRKYIPIVRIEYVIPNTLCELTILDRNDDYWK